MGHSPGRKGAPGPRTLEITRSPLPLPSAQPPEHTLHLGSHFFVALNSTPRRGEAQTAPAPAPPHPLLSPQPGDRASLPAPPSSGLCSGWDSAAPCCLLALPLLVRAPGSSQLQCGSAQRFSRTLGSEWVLAPRPVPFTWPRIPSTALTPWRPARFSVLISVCSLPPLAHEHRVSGQGHLDCAFACFLLMPDVCAGHWAHMCCLNK